MLNLNYATLAAAYRRYAALAPAALQEALGWSEYSGTPAYARNGAVLTSLGLLSAGVPLSGPLRIEAGPLAGRKVQNGANRLADWLAAHHKAPEMLSVEVGLGGVADLLFGRRGIVAFIQGSGPAGGSIALLDGHNAAAACIAAQGKHPLEVRFWEVY
ncbi:MAG TPA: hypothetical protein VJ572_08710 [Azonexus sp.]|nr:hypothetical protein [Azonexus sp.]